MLFGFVDLLLQGLLPQSCLNPLHSFLASMKYPLLWSSIYHHSIFRDRRQMGFFLMEREGSIMWNSSDHMTQPESKREQSTSDISKV
jgi:hypothetical protein